MLTVNQRFEHVFRVSQEQVNTFAEVTGDKNPLHLDPEYAAKTIFRRPAVHGAFAIGVFSKIMGMEFPGPGTIYLEHQIQFLKPMYPEVDYKAVVTLVSTVPDKHQGVFRTEIWQDGSDRQIVNGEATVFHRTLL
ncbi:MAG: MaoC family dehydratase [Bacteroidia bacterium]|nr:MaoC family dehydratase [Bacteroidia bacterium]